MIFWSVFAYSVPTTPPFQPWCSILVTKKHHRSRRGRTRRSTQRGPTLAQPLHLRRTAARANSAVMVQNASRSSALLAFFDSESRVPRISNPGHSRAFLGRRVSGAKYECTGAPRAWNASIPRTRACAYVVRWTWRSSSMMVSFLRVPSMCLLWRRTASRCAMEIFLCSDLRAPGQVWGVHRLRRL
jgi:hypothetical protein